VRSMKRVRNVSYMAICIIMCAFILWGGLHVNGGNPIMGLGGSDAKAQAGGADSETVQAISLIQSTKAQKVLDRIDEYPAELLELLARNHETIDFVADYPDWKDDGEEPVIDESAAAGSVPLFIQWDKRWGYKNYGDSMMGINGCGPTCLSMVIVALTGDTDMTPYALATFSAASGYYANESGTAWKLMNEGAQQLGLMVHELPLDENTIRKTLENGKPIIVSVTKGDFTSMGHYIVLTGVASDGTIIVNDPNSPLRSAKTWDLERIMGQTRNLWAYWVE
jgi:hypothetical protein